MPCKRPHPTHGCSHGGWLSIGACSCQLTPSYTSPGCLRVEVGVLSYGGGHVPVLRAAGGAGPMPFCGRGQGC